MQYPKLLSALAAVAIYGASSSLASAFTITSEFIVTAADDRAGPADAPTVLTAAPLGSQSTTATDGDNSATTTLDRAVLGDQATLSYSFAHARNGTPSSFALSESTIQFTVAANATYSATGFYSVNDSGTPGFVQYFGNLVDLTAPATLFSSSQNSQTTQDESFTLGGLGGDAQSNFMGALTGNLVAGHTYRLRFVVDIQALTQGLSVGDTGATSNGNITLKINGGVPPAGVPDAGSSVGLLALGLAGLAAARRKLMAA